ncbi:MAG: hypothetical protein PWQ91_135 [Eubacteriales bacterium]|nr:hypothetical protein [Eubacteriales bacterium]MDN5363074.1 hypothetical protein [Eubacteriales bacterium]
MEKENTSPFPVSKSENSSLGDNPAFPMEEKSGPPQVPGLLELIYNVLFHPARAMEIMAYAPPLKQSLIVFFGVAFFAMVTGLVTLSARMESLLSSSLVLPGSEAAMTSMTRFFLVFQPFLQYAFFFVVAGFYHLSGGLFGKKDGRAAMMLAVMGFVQLTSLPEILRQLLFYVLGLEGSFVDLLLTPLLSLAILIWGGYIIVQGLKTNYELDTVRAVIVLFLPFLLFFLMMVVFMIGMAAFLAPLGKAVSMSV